MSNHHHHKRQCEEWLGQLSDYIDGTLEAQLCAEIEQHLAGCHDCRVLVDTTQKTVLLFQRDHLRQQAARLPPDITARLWQALENAGCFSEPD